jgi:hypothetical protein
MHACRAKSTTRSRTVFKKGTEKSTIKISIFYLNFKFSSQQEAFVPHDIVVFKVCEFTATRYNICHVFARSFGYNIWMQSPVELPSRPNVFVRSACVLRIEVRCALCEYLHRIFYFLIFLRKYTFNTTQKFDTLAMSLMCEFLHLSPECAFCPSRAAHFLGTKSYSVRN